MSRQTAYQALYRVTVAYLPFVVAAMIIAVAFHLKKQSDAERPLKGFPLVGLEEEGLSPKEAWMKHGHRVMVKGLTEHKGAFQVMTGTGPKIMLPNRFTEEFRKNDMANLIQTQTRDNFAGWPGFDGMTFLSKHERVVVDAVRINLTQSMGAVTDSLVDETRLATPELFGQDKEWQTIPIKSRIGSFVSRLSSRVFLGPKLCRDSEWLEIAQSHTVNLFQASMAMREGPSLRRLLSFWFNPLYKRLRSQAHAARRILKPLIETRKAEVRKALAAGEKPEKVADLIGWMVAQAQASDIDYAAGQLGMSVVGIHTTTEALAEALVDLCQHPSLFQPLREEIVRELKDQGWTRTTLHRMRLMDSFLKESQRLHPASAASVNRYLYADVKLSDGTVLPKGSRIWIAGRFDDPELYPEPDKLDAYRFLNLRSEAGKSNTWQHTSMTPEHLGFGYGDHGCPGRFFASNELKIALSFLLLNYDWKLPDVPDNQTFIHFGVGNLLSPLCRLSYRRRSAEIEL
ncbi:cytochrome P450 monooxygenase [Chaetomium fimeti]|uniref:Cytochrome P450 monooxygenase n=1 Tax=Chaetomium fimeti TaxID=1854472 RepID=A0AAE0HR65_9PEZI|nr:cytochrome P450 monooxygenase [Chaetomium fimeti]